MKLEWKKVKMYCLILLLAGVIIMTMGILLGGRPGFSFGFEKDGGGFSLMSHDDQKYGTILEKTKINSVQNIAIDVSSLDVYIEESDDFYIEYNTRGEDIEYSDSNGLLSIKGTNKYSTKFSLLNFDIQETSYIRIYLPKDMEMQKIEIRDEYGDTKISDVSSNELILQSTAGDMILKNVTADTMDCGQSYGTLTGRDLAAMKFNASTDGGDIDIKDFKTNNADIESGIGEVELKLAGAEEDYSFELDAGFGDSQLNGKELAGHYRIDNGSKSVKVISRSGDIYIRTN